LEDQFIVSLAVINSVFDRLKWLVLYFFILEMQDVRIKVESSNLEVFQIRKAQLNCTKIIVVIVFIGLQLPIVVIQYYNKFNSVKLSKDWSDALKLFECSFRTLKLPLDFYIFYMYFQLLRFFIN
jgi:hypothetical protein